MKNLKWGLRVCLWSMAYLKYPCSDRRDVFRHTHTLTPPPPVHTHPLPYKSWKPTTRWYHALITGQYEEGWLACATRAPPFPFAQSQMWPYVWHKQSFGGGDRRRLRLQPAHQLSIRRTETSHLIEAVDISTRPIFIINISRPLNCHEHYCDMSLV